MTLPIISTKLAAPTPRPGTISRPALLAKISSGMEKRLMLIAAPAGYGKTTLLADWLAGPGMSIPAAWVTLEEAENDPSRFLLYLIKALQVIQPDWGQDAYATLRSSQDASAEEIIALLINEINAFEKDFILALDDYHQIENQSVHELLVFFLEHLPGNTHLFILSRIDPPLPLARLRARGQLVEIRRRNLEFDYQEAGRFLNGSMGLTLSGPQIKVLLERTEGWAAGLQLAGLSLEGRKDAAKLISAFGSRSDYIFDYLIDEVLDQQPQAIRDFLLRTSILKRMSGDLCDALTGQASGLETLEKLEKENLFITCLSDSTTWFRYHRLFADVLINRLRRLHPESIPDLHRRAAAWFQQQNLVAEAVDHALAANDPRLAAELIEGDALAMLQGGEAAPLAGWLDRLQEEFILERPRLAVYSIWAHMLTGKQIDAESFVSRIEKRAREAGEYGSLRGDFAAIRAYHASMMGKFEASLALANEALERLGENNRTVRAVMHFVLGGIHYMQEDFDSAIESMEMAADLGSQSGNLNITVPALNAIGAMYLQQKKLGPAGQVFARAEALATGPGGTRLPIASAVLAGIARLHIAKHELDQAAEHAKAAVELGEKWMNGNSQVSGWVLLAKIAHMQGDTDRAYRALQNARQTRESFVLTPDADQEISGCEAFLSAPPPKRADQGALIDPLSEREIEVLQLFAEGLSNREIAEKIIVSLGTVKAHSSNIYRKLDVRNRAQAVITARQLGLV